MLGGVGCHGFVQRHPAHIQHIVGDDLVRTVLDPLGGDCVGWTAVGRVVLETAVFGRVVRRGNDHPVRLHAFVAGIPGQDGVRDNGRGGVLMVPVDMDLHPVASEDLNSSVKRWF